jgi:fructokinase
MNNSYQVVCFGELLWDLLPSGARPGGAPMNVAYHLHKLGLQPALISRVGRDERGQGLLDVLARQGLPLTFIQEDPAQPTGVVHATIGANHEVSYDIVEPVAWDFIQGEERLTALVQGAEFFVFGSLAARQVPSRNTLFELIEAAAFRVADINLRAPHYSREVLESLLRQTNLLKLNEHELPIIAGWSQELSGMEEQVQLVQDRFRIPTIVVTMGGKGALLNKEGTVTRHPGYKVAVEDTVGSGDAFLAGFLSGTKQGLGAAECLQFANAMGAFVATKSGACPDYEVTEVRELAGGYEAGQRPVLEQEP